MSRVCTICTHDEHHSINAALGQGTPYRTIAHQYDVSRYALMRHTREHLPGKALSQAEAQAAPHAPAHEGKMLREAKVQAVPHAPARETHQGKMIGLDSIPTAPTRVRVRETHQGKMLKNVNVQAAPRVRVRADTGHATRMRIREQLQANYGPHLAALEREAEVLHRKIGDLRRDLQVVRKRRSEAKGSGTTSAVPVPMPDRGTTRREG